MATEIVSRLWRRRYRVDEFGVSESRWDGSPLRFIPWDQLAQIRPGSLRSSSGERIRPRLELDKKRFLMGSVVAEWRLRFPAAWREDNARRYQLCRRTTFVYLPLIIALPLLLWYLPPWILAGQPLKGTELVKFRVFAIMGGFGLVLSWFHYFKWGRHDFSQDEEPDVTDLPAAGR